MNKSQELKTTTDIVREVLKAHEQARNCDDYLYFLVCTIIGKQKGFDVENMPLSYFLLHRSTLKIPPFESVRRSRQKLQQHHPELAGNDKIEGYRTDNERIFRNYARALNV